MKLESWHAEEFKNHWKLVRLDDGTDVQGIISILSADEATGECIVTMQVGGSVETRTLNFGSFGVRIVPRKGRYEDYRLPPEGTL